jgi:hypothetical protein
MLTIRSRTVRNFNVTVRKISHHTGTVLVNDKYLAMNKTANPIIFKFTIENKHFKILNPSAYHKKVLGYTVILFHEIIPLIISNHIICYTIINMVS